MLLLLLPSGYCLLRLAGVAVAYGMTLQRQQCTTPNTSSSEYEREA
jgi:hypothetical protein